MVRTARRCGIVPGSDLGGNGQALADVGHPRVGLSHTALQLAVQIDNLFNHEYYTAAWLSNTELTAQGAVQSLPFQPYATGPYAGSAASQSATFFAPGAPRRAWVELRLRF